MWAGLAQGVRWLLTKKARRSFSPGSAGIAELFAPSGWQILQGELGPSSGFDWPHAQKTNTLVRSVNTRRHKRYSVYTKCTPRVLCRSLQTDCNRCIVEREG